MTLLLEGVIGGSIAFGQAGEFKVRALQRLTGTDTAEAYAGALSVARSRLKDS